MRPQPKAAAAGRRTTSEPWKRTAGDDGLEQGKEGRIVSRAVETRIATTSEPQYVDGRIRLDKIQKRQQQNERPCSATWKTNNAAGKREGRERTGDEGEYFRCRTSDAMNENQPKQQQQREQENETKERSTYGRAARRIGFTRHNKEQQSNE